MTELATKTSTQQACQALAYPRSSYYRQQQTKPARRHRVPVPSPRALPPLERDAVRKMLNSERFADSSPRQVYGTLLDEGQYLCSVSTMYRILQEHHEVRERRNQKRHPVYKKPELLATAPNQVWTWDITKLRGPVKHVYYYMYTILDIFSRYVVGWMIAHREQAALAKRLINDSCTKQQIEAEQLTLHADRGSSMKSKAVAHLLGDLGVTKTHSRPHVSNDNPYSEAQFKTLKYCPQFPERFGSIQDARAFCQPFFNWYNKEHRHSGIALMTPEQVHYDMNKQIFQHRSDILAAAFEKNPNRFKGQLPVPKSLPKAAWINKPETDQLESNLLTCVSHFH